MQIINGGTASQFMPQLNNFFERIYINGFKYCYVERYKMGANYNLYNKLDTKVSEITRNPDANGYGTEEDIGFNFSVIDGVKGGGNEVITGDKIESGDYEYALNSDETSYNLLKYSGLDAVITIPQKI